MSDPYYKWFHPDKDVVINMILCSDKEVKKLYLALDRKVDGPDGEQRHRLLKSLLKKKLSEKQAELRKLNVVELNDMNMKLQGWPVTEPSVCVPSVPTKLSQRIKNEIQKSKSAQRRGAPLKEQWSFLQWTKRAERNCKFAALRREHREAKEKEAIQQLLKK